MVATDISTLAVPAGLSLPDREADVVEQRVYVSDSWWQAHLDSRGLPGGPLQTQRDANGSFLTRSAVWAHAADVQHDDAGALRLLWHVLAWGAGLRSVRNESRRLDAVAADPARAAALLQQAAALALTQPEQAYAVLYPRGQGVITRLGPAFGTKYLYFAGGGAPGHRSLILDARVATSLHEAGWTSLPRAGWLASAYLRYIDLMARWSAEVSTAEKQVTGDMLEFALFRHSSSGRRGLA